MSRLIVLGIRRVIVTDTWIILVTSYGLKVAQQSDVVLQAVRADEHQVGCGSYDVLFSIFDESFWSDEFLRLIRL